MNRLPLWLPLVLLSGTGYAESMALPPLQLAAEYQQQDVTHYRVSEKLDGVRAYWNGRELLSRGGHRFSAPDWFVAGFPDMALDGELWLGRGRFEDLSAAVRRYRPDEPEWRQIRFMVFDLPASELPFETRLTALERLFSHLDSPYIELLEQRRLPDNAALAAYLTEVEALGGEGLMLRHRDSLYLPTRNQDLLKLKRFQDAEARVLAHLPGQGKFEGMLGALLVETDDGRRFKLGTGFSDRQRQQPPAVGSIVTYRYRGETGQRMPRFASFVRIRNDEPERP
ncbi:DNA ligase [Oceanisphaera arctica]|uniref:DNA ligase n=1 Tax=Oceanisphaera arctica TaxID=641510 RepID=A0A2P5TL84_9GAMM|nr:DNA ligase [Oceanisphaera arctica]PPL15950.1 DNA ligase [Oceanisphaera arctica]GHA21636.1 ATP-dependent DNA ligase [Oceanisphaera arctica]